MQCQPLHDGTWAVALLMESMESMEPAGRLGSGPSPFKVNDSFGFGQ